MGPLYLTPDDEPMQR